MSQFEENEISISNFTIAYKTWGKKHARPILCLHGKMDNAASFDLLTPLLTDGQVVSLDLPGNGLSSHYPSGVLPHWKNDAFLVLKFIETLQWNEFDIVAHSLGSLIANIIAIAIPERIKNLIFIDTLGPTINFIENADQYLHNSVKEYLKHPSSRRTVFQDIESAIQDRMKIGKISYQAAQALVSRGMVAKGNEFIWSFDQRLRCVSSTVPFEDEIISMLKRLTIPLHLIKANQGIPYPDTTFKCRAQALQQLQIHSTTGGHHVHMDNPHQVASIINSIIT